MLDKTNFEILNKTISEPKAVFLTAKDLGIPQKWYDALLLVEAAMARHEFRHVPEEHLNHLMIDYRDDLSKGHEFRGAFNMSFWNETGASCGTICCIGGAAESLGNVRVDLRGINGLPKPKYCDLYNLFHPPQEYDWDAITVEQAHYALTSYLTTGKPNWESILSVLEEMHV